jgi:hypothetical protein
MTACNAINFFSPAKWVVSTVAGEGTHTTISSAITSASSGDTIVIMPGTYTENPTLKARVNLTAFGCDSSSNGTGLVIINGQCTLSTAGSVTISGIQLQTNSAALLVVTGSAASIVNLNNCYLNCTNANGIVFNCSNSSSQINVNYCSGNLVTTNINIYNMSSTGTLTFYCTNFTNSGASTTHFGNSNGVVNIFYSKFNSPISTSAIGTINIFKSIIDTSAQNTASLTTLGTGNNTSQGSGYLSGSDSAISVGSGTTLSLTQDYLSSSNTNTLTGLGTVVSNGIIFNGLSHLSNVTTQTGGAASGLTQGTAPSAGFIGEQIKSTRASGSALSLTGGVTANLTTISLTSGIWNVSCVGTFINGVTTINTSFSVGISLTSATLGPTPSDDSAYFNSNGITNFGMSFTVPSYRITLSSTTTVYLVATAGFTTSTCSAYGTLTATRVG